MVETSGPTFRMMSKGKRSTNTKKKSQQRHFFFERGGAGGMRPQSLILLSDTLIKNVEKGSGSRDPTLQKAIEESAKALRAEIEKREKAQKDKEMGEAIYQSIIELSKKEETEKEMQNPLSQEEEAVLEPKAISLKLLKREREKKDRNREKRG